MGRFSITGRQATVDTVRGPELEHKPKQRDTRLIDEINDKGCYIHVSSNTDNKIALELDKIVNETLPTPATLVGECPVILYDTHQWKDCSGFVFTPHAPSLLAHKHDFWSNRLRTNSSKNFADILKKKKIFIPRTKEEALKKYSTYLSTNFNAIDEETQSTLGRSKKLFLEGDIAFSRAKYREMKLRCRGTESAPVSDIASKFLIADLPEIKGRALERWSRRELVAKLTDASEKNDVLGEVLEHAIIKINKMNSKQYKDYTKAASDRDKRSIAQGHYTKFIERYGGLPANEHLLLPSLEDVKGIYVNHVSTEEIDHGFELKKALEQRQTERGLRQYNSAILYRPSVNQDNNYFLQAGWAQVLLPWSTKGLIEFAKTGMVTADDGKVFQPQHAKLLKMMLTPELIEMMSTPEYNFDRDFGVAKVKEGKDNLLHLAIESGRDSSVIEFFYYHNVSPTEIGEKGKSVIELAADCCHPAREFLVTMNDVRSVAQLVEGVLAFILKEDAPRRR